MKQNVQICSPASSGNQRKCTEYISFLSLPPEAQHCQFLTLVFLFKTFFFGGRINKKQRRLPPMLKYTLSRNVYLEDDIHPAGQYIIMTQTNLPTNMHDYENLM